MGRRGGSVVLVACALAACGPRSGPEPEIVAAVRANDREAVAAYLQAGGDPNATTAEGETLLYLATGPRGGMAVLEALIIGGADIHAGRADGRTPLMNAAGWCDVPMVVALLAAGADPSVRGLEGTTARDQVCAGPIDRRRAVLESLDAALR